MYTIVYRVCLTKKKTMEEKVEKLIKRLKKENEVMQKELDSGDLKKYKTLVRKLTIANNIKIIAELSNLSK
jgi:hypothetical protein